MRPLLISVLPLLLASVQSQINSYTTVISYNDDFCRNASTVQMEPTRTTCSSTGCFNRKQTVCYGMTSLKDLDSVFAEHFHDQPFVTKVRYEDDAPLSIAGVLAVVANGQCYATQHQYVQATLKSLNQSMELVSSSDSTCWAPTDTVLLARSNHYQARVEVSARNIGNARWPAAATSNGTNWTSTRPVPTPQEKPPSTPAPTLAALTPEIRRGCTSNIVALQADTGKVVANCVSCTNGQASPNSAMINAYSPENNPSAQWRLMRLANGKVALQNVDSYRYLARCNNCYYYGSYPDSAFVHVEDPLDAPWAQWDMSEVHPGVVTFKSDSGLYLARCSNCVYGSYPDALFVHVSDADWNSAGQFKLYCK